MSKKNLIQQAEREVFRASFEDGLIDIGIAAFTLMFAVAPLLSETLGDFWSSFVFLPFYGLLYILLRWVRKQFVLPKMGSVVFGAERVAKLRRGGRSDVGAQSDLSAAGGGHLFLPWGTGMAGFTAFLSNNADLFQHGRILLRLNPIVCVRSNLGLGNARWGSGCGSRDMRLIMGTQLCLGSQQG